MGSQILSTIMEHIKDAMKSKNREKLLTLRTLHSDIKNVGINKRKEVTDEDWNLTMRLYENGYKVLYDPGLVASGECPNTLKRLFKQQARWAEGHTRTFRSHFLKIWRNKFLNLREKIDFVFIGASFMNSILIVLLSLSWLITLLFPTVYLPIPIVQTGFFLLLVSMPAGVSASMAALSSAGISPSRYAVSRSENSQVVIVGMDTQGLPALRYF